MPNPEANTSGQGLSTAQTIILVVLGAVLWFLTACSRR